MYVCVRVLVENELQLAKRLLVLYQKHLDQAVNLGVKLIVGYGPVEQSPLDAPRRRMQSADQVDLLRPTSTNQSNHPRGATPAGRHGTVDLRHPPTATLPRDHEVASHCYLQTAT